VANAYTAPYQFFPGETVRDRKTDTDYVIQSVIALGMGAGVVVYAMGVLDGKITQYEAESLESFIKHNNILRIKSTKTYVRPEDVIKNLRQHIAKAAGENSTVYERLLKDPKLQVFRDLLHLTAESNESQFESAIIGLAASMAKGTAQSLDAAKVKGILNRVAAGTDYTQEFLDDLTQRIINANMRDLGGKNILDLDDSTSLVVDLISGLKKVNLGSNAGVGAMPVGGFKGAGELFEKAGVDPYEFVNTVQRFWKGEVDVLNTGAWGRLPLANDSIGDHTQLTNRVLTTFQKYYEANQIKLSQGDIKTLTAQIKNSIGSTSFRSKDAPRDYVPPLVAKFAALMGGDTDEVRLLNKTLFQVGVDYSEKARDIQNWDKHYRRRGTIYRTSPGRTSSSRRVNAVDMAKFFEKDLKLSGKYQMSLDLPTFFKDVVGSKELRIGTSGAQSISGKAGDKFIQEALASMFGTTGLPATFIFEPSEVIALQQASTITLDSQFITEQLARVEALKQAKLIPHTNTTDPNRLIAGAVDTGFDALLRQHGELSPSTEAMILDSTLSNVVAFGKEGLAQGTPTFISPHRKELLTPPQVAPGKTRYVGLEFNEGAGLQKSNLYPEDQFFSAMGELNSFYRGESDQPLGELATKLERWYDNERARLVYSDVFSTEKSELIKARDKFSTKLFAGGLSPKDLPEWEFSSKVEKLALSTRAEARAHANLTRMAVVNLKQGGLRQQRLIGSEINRGLVEQLESAKSFLVGGGLVLDTESKLVNGSWRTTELAVHKVNAKGKAELLHSSKFGTKGTELERAEALVSLADIFKSSKGSIMTQGAYDFSHYIREITRLEADEVVAGAIGEKLAQAKATFLEVMQKRLSNMQLLHQYYENLGTTNQEYLTIRHLGEMETHSAISDNMQAIKLAFLNKEDKVRALETMAEQVGSNGQQALILNKDPISNLYGSITKVHGFYEEPSRGVGAVLEFMAVKEGRVEGTGTFMELMAESRDQLGNLLMRKGEFLGTKLTKEQQVQYNEMLADEGGRLFRALNPNNPSYIDDTLGRNWNPGVLGSIGFERLRADFYLAKHFRKDQEKISKGYLDIEEVVAQRFRKSNLSIEHEDYFRNRAFELLSDPRLAEQVFNEASPYGKILADREKAGTMGGALNQILMGKEFSGYGDEGVTKASMYMNMLYGRLPEDMGFTKKIGVSRLSFSFDELGKNIDFSDPAAGIRNISKRMDELATEALFGNFLQDEKATATEEVLQGLLRDSGTITQLKNELRTLKANSGVQQNTEAWFRFIQTKSGEMRHSDEISPLIKNAWTQLRSSDEFVKPVRLALLDKINAGGDQEIANAMQRLLDSSLPNGKLAEGIQAELLKTLAPNNKERVALFTKEGAAERVQNFFKGEVEILDIGKMVQVVNESNSTGGTIAQQLVDAVEAHYSNAIEAGMPQEYINTLVTNAARKAKEGMAELNPEERIRHYGFAWEKEFKEALALHNSVITPNPGTMFDREAVGRKIMEETKSVPRIGEDPIDLMKGQHEVILNTFVNGAKHLEGIHVPLMAIGGALALMATYSPQDSEGSQGNLTAHNPDPILRTSGLPGESTPHTVWHQDISPFMVNISFRGTIESEEHRKKFMNEVFDSISGTMRLTKVNHDVKDQRERHHTMAARDLLNRF